MTLAPFPLVPIPAGEEDAGAGAAVAAADWPRSPEIRRDLGAGRTTRPRATESGATASSLLAGRGDAAPKGPPAPDARLLESEEGVLHLGISKPRPDLTTYDTKKFLVICSLLEHVVYRANK